MKRLLILCTFFLFAGPLSAQQVPVDSQAIAAAIVKSILPELQKREGATRRVTIAAGAPFVGPGRDTTSPWLRFLRAELLSQAPALASDSTRPAGVIFRFHNLSIGDSLVSSDATISVCQPERRGSMNFYVDFLSLAISRAGGAWQAAQPRMKGHADGSCS